MNINIKTTTFGDLKRGETFRLNNFDYMYAKTEPIQYKDADGEIIKINTHILNNGNLIYFPDSQSVIRVNTEIREVE